MCRAPICKKVLSRERLRRSRTRHSRDASFLRRLRSSWRATRSWGGCIRSGPGSRRGCRRKSSGELPRCVELGLHHYRAHDAHPGPRPELSKPLKKSFASVPDCLIGDRADTQELSVSCTARCASDIAALVLAAAAASELAIEIRPNCWRPITHGFASSEAYSGSQIAPWL